MAEQTGVAREKLSLESRLSFDLGIEGDDAVELFDGFKREFEVDVSELHLYWDSYFAPEGISWVTAVFVGAPVILVAIVLSKFFPKWPDWLSLPVGATIGFAGVFGWTALMRRPGPNEITIGELIEAAQTGRFRVQSAVKERIAALSER